MTRPPEVQEAMEWAKAKYPDVDDAPMHGENLAAYVEVLETQLAEENRHRVNAVKIGLSAQKRADAAEATKAQVDLTLADTLDLLAEKMKENTRLESQLSADKSRCGPYYPWDSEARKRMADLEAKYEEARQEWEKAEDRIAALKEKVESEHELFLTAHRDNMATANRIAALKSEMGRAKKSFEAIYRKTKRFETGNLWTVKRDAEEGLAAIERATPSPKGAE